MAAFSLFGCGSKVGVEGVEHVCEAEGGGVPSGRIGVADGLAQRVLEMDGIGALLQDAASVDLTGYLVNGESSLAAAFVQICICGKAEADVSLDFELEMILSCKETRELLTSLFTSYPTAFGELRHRA